MIGRMKVTTRVYCNYKQRRLGNLADWDHFLIRKYISKKAFIKTIGFCTKLWRIPYDTCLVPTLPHSELWKLSQVKAKRKKCNLNFYSSLCIISSRICLWVDGFSAIPTQNRSPHVNYFEDLMEVCNDLFLAPWKSYFHSKWTRKNTEVFMWTDWFLK